MLQLSLFLFYLIIFCGFYLLKSCIKPKNFPPGPSWLPIFGSLRKFKKLCQKLGGQYLVLNHLSKEYNSPVIGLKLGNYIVVSVSGYQSVRNVLTNSEFDYRPNDFFVRLRCMGERRGITCVDGSFWQEQRHFIEHHLRVLGYGKKPMEALMCQEVESILQILKSTTEPVVLEPIFAPSVLNVIWTFTTGTNISRDDPKLKTFLELIKNRNKAFDMGGGILNQMPWLRFIVPDKIGYNAIVKLNKDLCNFFADIIQVHYDTWNEDNQDDLIYSFISEMRKETNRGKYFTEDQLVMICLDLFLGGSTTTSNSLAFLFLEMILNPNIQEKAAKCLKDAFPDDEQINYADRYKVPYIEAIIMESERINSVVPIMAPRRITKNTILEGFNVPENATLLVDVHSVHNDKEYWGDPDVFRPERFLDAQGRLLPGERVLNFGLGRRRCLGEVLARQCLFIYFTTILRKFKIVSTGDKILSRKPVPGIILAPQNFYVKVIPRDN